LFLKTVLSDMERNSAGRLFHVTGPANEKARSPNLIIRDHWWLCYYRFLQRLLQQKHRGPLQ